MATRAGALPDPVSNDDRFFLGGAIAMVLLIVAGFSLQLAAGRSSFDAPPLVHAHAIVYMGWLVIFLMQTVFATSGNIAMHRRLGWIGAGWIGLMIVLGFMVTFAMLRRGGVPFFFTPMQFLALDPLSVLFFAGLTAAAIRMRKQTDWHRRLHFCAMALLLGPGAGRLLPMPLLIPWAFEATFVVTLLFPLAGVIADYRRDGRVHPAWGWGIAAIFGFLIAVETLTYTPLGQPLYAAVTKGTPGASVPPLAFPPPPGAV
jgi:hypothetical protein